MINLFIVAPRATKTSFPFEALEIKSVTLSSGTSNVIAFASLFRPENLASEP